MRIAPFLVTLTLSTTLHSSLAFAASFDCAKAKQPAELLICGVPALSKVDSQMGDIYRKNLAELSPNAAQQYKDGQRDWLIYWPGLCANDAGKIDSKSEETVQCAKTEYAARIASLKLQKRTVENLLAYPISHYRVLKSTAGLDFIKNAHHTETRMAIDVEAAPPEQKELANAINHWLGSSPIETSNTNGEDETTSDTEIQLSFKDAASPLILSAQQTGFLMGHGAAHPLSASSQRHFNLPSKRPLRTDDIFQGKEWEDTLTQLAEKGLKKQLADNYSVEKVEALKVLVVQPEHWVFDKKGLTLTFNPYEVAPYAAGAPEVTIPWSTLSRTLNPAFSASLPKVAAVRR
jgi:uncharacterized protein